MKANKQLMARRAWRPAEQSDQWVGGRIDGPGSAAWSPRASNEGHTHRREEHVGDAVMSRTTTLTWYAPSTVFGTQRKVLVGLKSRTI